MRQECLPFERRQIPPSCQTESPTHRTHVLSPVAIQPEMKTGLQITNCNVCRSCMCVVGCWFSSAFFAWLDVKMNASQHLFNETSLCLRTLAEFEQILLTTDPLRQFIICWLRWCCHFFHQLEPWWQIYFVAFRSGKSVDKVDLSEDVEVTSSSSPVSEHNLQQSFLSACPNTKVPTPLPNQSCPFRAHSLSLQANFQDRTKFLMLQNQIQMIASWLMMKQICPSTSLNLN